MTDHADLIARLKRWHADTGAPSYKAAYEALEAQEQALQTAPAFLRQVHARFVGRVRCCRHGQRSP